MSQWTHVAGVIRLDTIRHINDLAPDFGKIVDYDDEEWGGSSIPCGSEGSLVWIAWTNPHQGSIAAYTVTVFGDLRDYDDEAAIISWLNERLRWHGKNHMSCRQATVHIDVEGRYETSWTWDGKKFVMAGVAISGGE